MPTIGLTRFEFVRSMVFQFTNKFSPDSRWVLGSLLFIAGKFGDLSLLSREKSPGQAPTTSH
jgi:hypothetical protein